MPKDREVYLCQSQELSKCFDENDPVEADRLQSEALTRHRKRRKNSIERTIEELRETLTDDERYVMALAYGKRASNWLPALPLQRYGFNLTKTEFKDGLALRYGWQPKKLSSRLSMCRAFHSRPLTTLCQGGRVYTHSSQWDPWHLCKHHEKSLLRCRARTKASAVRRRVRQKTTTTDDVARLDIKANGRWETRFSRTYFDVKIFNPLAKLCP